MEGCRLFHQINDMHITPVKYLLLICIPVLGSLWFYLVEAGAAKQTAVFEEMLKIEFLKMKKHVNGQVSQSFAIHLPPDASPKILYRINQEPAFWTARITDKCFTIWADSPSQFELFVLSVNPDTMDIVHTDFKLFGKSKTPVKRVPAELTDLKWINRLPYITLLAADTYYWHQTGTVLNFTLSNTLSKQGPTFFAHENGSIRSLVPDHSQPDQFVYIPIHDERLKQSGYAASRQDTVFTQLEYNGTIYQLAYPLLLHRSRYAHDNHTAGGIVFGIGILVFTALVLQKRKTHPWWNE